AYCTSCTLVTRGVASGGRIAPGSTAAPTGGDQATYGSGRRPAPATSATPAPAGGPAAPRRAASLPRPPRPGARGGGAWRKGAGGEPVPVASGGGEGQIEDGQVAPGADGLQGRPGGDALTHPDGPPEGERVGHVEDAHPPGDGQVGAIVGEGAEERGRGDLGPVAGAPPGPGIDVEGIEVAHRLGEADDGARLDPRRDRRPLAPDPGPERRWQVRRGVRRANTRV